MSLGDQPQFLVTSNKQRVKSLISQTSLFYNYCLDANNYSTAYLREALLTEKFTASCAEQGWWRACTVACSTHCTSTHPIMKSVRYKLTLGVCEQNVFNIYFKVLNQIYLIALGHSLWGIMPKPMQQKYNKFPLRRVQFSEVTCEKISFKDFLSNLCYASKQKLLTTQSCSSSF
jgi:hypothetical protein